MSPSILFITSSTTSKIVLLSFSKMHLLGYKIEVKLYALSLGIKQIKKSYNRDKLADGAKKTN